MPDISASSVPIDLSRLAAPPVVQPLSFEQIRADIIADFQARCSAAGIGYDAIVESDPAVKLLEELAYREMLGTAAINDTARSMMLAFAAEGDLDHLAAYYGVQRLITAPADGDTPAVMERDPDLRVRVQLAPETFPSTGRTAGGYRAMALAVAPNVKDVHLVKRDGGRVDVILLGREGDGLLDDDTVTKVYRAFQAEDATQLTDNITVGAAAIIPYSPVVTVHIRSGPDPQVVRAAAEAAIRTYAADRHRIGQSVFAQMITAAASVGSVERADVDIGDVNVGPREAAWMEALTVTVQVIA